MDSIPHPDLKPGSGFSWLARFRRIEPDSAGFGSSQPNQKSGWDDGPFRNHRGRVEEEYVLFRVRSSAWFTPGFTFRTAHSISSHRAYTPGLLTSSTEHPKSISAQGHGMMQFTPRGVPPASTFHTDDPQREDDYILRIRPPWLVRSIQGGRIVQHTISSVDRAENTTRAIPSP